MDIEPFVSARRCPKCGRTNKWTLYWQTVTRPGDFNDVQTSGEIHVTAIRVTIVLENIPDDVAELVVHVCECGYFFATHTFDSKIASKRG